MDVGLFNTQDNLPGNSDSIEEVVNEAHIIDESVHVTGAEHEQGGQALRNEKDAMVNKMKVERFSAAASLKEFLKEKETEVRLKYAVLTVKSKAGMGVQRLTWIMASRLGRWPSLAPAKNNLWD